MHDTLPKLTPSNFPAISRNRLETLQVNLGYLCNQQCLHCHVAAGPKRTEVMDSATVDLVIKSMDAIPLSTLDLTGGAPELNPDFRRLVAAARSRGLHVIDRCNLSVMFEPGQEGLAEFLAEQQVEVVASLPCYLEENVDRQRGKGAFGLSIKGLQWLNELGYGAPEGGLSLNLVYNPQGPSLPPPQAGLEADYRRELFDKFSVRFNRLLALANLPIRRFGSAVLSRGEFDDYMVLLKGAHNENNLKSVMCRSLVSVDWQGYLYDCDFNQMLGLKLYAGEGMKPHLRELPVLNLEEKSIMVADHCYGCTAGQGSSCGGALR